MKTVLITGANRSIGFEIAHQMLKGDHYVYLGSRNLEKGREAADTLKAAGLDNVEPIQLDVTNPASVKSAREEVGKKTDALDVLINNAGINGGLPQTATGSEIGVSKEVFDVNLYGVVRVTQAFADLLRNSPEPRIVNVTSGQGSLTVSSDPTSPYYHHKGAIYQSSKAALNMYTINLAYELRDTAFKANAVDPGFTKTDFNNHRGTGTVEDAAKRIVKYAVIGPEGPTGKYFSEQYNPETAEIPW